MTGAEDKAVVVFRHLTLANLPAAILCRLAGQRVIFIEPMGRLRNRAAIARLRRLGIEWVDYHAYAGFAVNADLTVTGRYAAALTANGFFDSDLDYLTTEVPGLSGHPRRARALLFDRVAKSLMDQAPAYALAQYFRDRGVRANVFLRGGSVDAIVRAGRVTDVRNLNPLTIPAAAGVLLAPAIWAARLIGRLRGTPPAPSSETTPPAAGSPEVLFFPHMGPTYGQLYVKDQYYSEDPASPFHPHRMGHVELSWLMSPAQKAKIAESYRALGLTPTFLALAGRSAEDKLRAVARQFRRTRGTPAALARAALLGQIDIQVGAYRDSFRGLQGARLALIDSDNHFPRVGTIALQSMGIRVAALQDRFLTPFFGAFIPLFDVMMVHGEIVKRHIESNPDAAVDRILVTGDPRTEKFDDYRAAARQERDRRFAEFDKVCVVYDFHSTPDPFRDAMAFGPDWRSNRDFYAVVADLAEARPDCAFVIRGKDDAWLDLPVMADIRARIDGMANLSVDRSYDRVDRSYELAAMADLIIARYTSICDQCLAAGVPVLIYDALPDGRGLISGCHDYAPYPVMVYDAETLHRRFNAVMDRGEFMAPEQAAEMRRDYYAVAPGTKPEAQACIARALSSIYQGAEHAAARPELQVKA